MRPTLFGVLRWSPRSASARSCLALLALLLVLPTSALADDSSAAPAPDDTVQAPAPSGPSLQPSDSAPVVCDPAKTGFRFLEIRGSGFDSWASQRLVGNLLDGAGVPQVQWGSVWVSPQGKLTLEVNLCNDPFRGRPALAAGNYTVAVGAASGPAIAATTVSLNPPPDTGTVDATAPDVEGAPARGLPTTANTPRTGPGSRTQPLPLGASTMLSDGWQFVVTSVNADAYDAVHSAVPSSIAPPADQRYVLLGVQAIYVGQGNGVLSGIRFGLLGKSGAQYDQIKNGCGAIPQTLPSTLIPLNGGLTGNICFSVPANDVDGLLLFDSQSNQGNAIYFALR